jgi:uroporphyrinogen III methyltransferase/synthase
MASNRPLTSPLVLIAPSAPQALTAELEGVGARVLNWPQLNIRAPDSFAPLDEAIENLFGYDWLIFQNAHAVDFFFRQFKTLGREMSEIDSLRVCAAGAAAVSHLDASQVHIDVVSDSHSSRAIFDAIETYVGGRDSLRGAQLSDSWL